MLKPVQTFYGTDPEGFFQRDRVIIGSERVLPQEGLKKDRYSKPDVVLDGIQFELNPPAAPSIRGLGMNLSSAFLRLQRQLQRDSLVTCCWDGLVEVSRAELDALSEKSRILGCQPSKNIYGVKPITVDPKIYQKRSAGGHAHFGLDTTPIMAVSNIEDERHRLVPLFDIFVGNTCVLLDRDPGAAERRENYGRAGEYRLPDYGVEYRTLSNFWLRNYSLMSLVFGLCDIAISTLIQTLKGEPLEDELIEVVNIDRVIHAIDTNNYDLARANFEDIRPFLVKHLPTYEFPLNAGNLDKFLLFTEAAAQKGLDAFFPEERLSHWTSQKFVEFQDFLNAI